MAAETVEICTAHHLDRWTFYAPDDDAMERPVMGSKCGVCDFQIIGFGLFFHLPSCRGHFHGRA